MLSTSAAAPLTGATPEQPPAPKTEAARPSYTPPADSDIPDGPFGDMIRLGEAIFHDTQHNAKGFVGNDLQCSNCQRPRGRVSAHQPVVRLGRRRPSRHRQHRFFTASRSSRPSLSSSRSHRLPSCWPNRRKSRLRQRVSGGVMPAVRRRLSLVICCGLVAAGTLLPACSPSNVPPPQAPAPQLWGDLQPPMCRSRN